MGVSVLERKHQGVRPRRGGAVQDGGIEVEQPDNERFAIVERGTFKHDNLSADARAAEQPGLALQQAREPRQIVTGDRTQDLLHDECLPKMPGCHGGNVEAMLTQIPEEGVAAQSAIDPSAEVLVERDATLQQHRRDLLVLEATGTDECIIDGGELVGVAETGTQRAGRIKAFTHAVEIAQRHQDPQRAPHQALAPKQLQQSPRPRVDEAVPYRRGDCSAGIDEEFSAGWSRENLFPLSVEAAGVWTGSTEQRATAPRDQVWVLRQELLQPLDVVVVNGLFRLLSHPLLSFARSFEDLLSKILPTCETILTREDQLGVPLRQG